MQFGSDSERRRGREVASLARSLAPWAAVAFAAVATAGPLATLGHVLGRAADVAAATPSPGPSAAAIPGAPTAEAIFAAMRSALLARTYPNEISYAVAVEGWDGKKWSGRTYDTFAFPKKGELRAKTLSREEDADPYHPSGSTFAVLGFDVGGTGSAKDALGVPRLTPTYAFGLVPAPRPAPTGAPKALPSNAPETIGESSAIAKIYTVTLVGPEPVYGIPCWHLKLAPIGNPGKYRVRDVWVSRTGSQLVRLNTEGNFTGTETGSGIWTVDYARADDGSWYITNENSTESVASETATFIRMRVRFIEVKADRREFYDVGISTADLKILQEP